MRSNLGVLAAGLCAATTGLAHAGGIVTQDLNQGATLEGIIAKLVGPGVTVSNASYTGANRAIGLFSGGSGIVGFDAGIILSTGDIADAAGPNTSQSTSSNNGTPGDADLDGRGVGTTFDAAVLQFDLECDEAQSITVRYVFGSEEYNEYVDTKFNDIFGFYLNGTNISYIGGDPVAINSINCGNPFAGAGPNCAFFINNPPGSGNVDLEFDGLTVVLTTTAPLNPGVNTIKIAIADVADSVWDSAIFIENGSFQCASGLSCGSDSAGDCCDINNEPYCNDKECCFQVCAVLPHCCEALWDVACAGLANEICEVCEPKVSPKGTLVLTADDCQDDAFPGYPGDQIVVQLSMEDLTVPVSGFQAFILFDDDALNYEGTLSSYTDSPFTLHIRAAADAQTDEGELELDGSFGFGGGSTDEPAKLATLVFTVKTKCEKVYFDFGGSNFDSELSIDGTPIPTNLVPSETIVLDDNPPDIKCPENIKVPADVVVNGKIDPCVGAIVEFEVWADDDCNLASVKCYPESGSFFYIGTTTVVCVATDKCGNTRECEFTVTVNATNLVKADIMLWGSEATDRCIHFVGSDCGAVANVLVEFGEVEFGAKGQAVFELPCGVYDFLCAKDEQHTKWDTVLLGTDGRCWYGLEQHVLYPGDTDNDGDVDINDVTWLIATFGDLHAPGGCPWDGTRDADFSNNGAVLAEDYSLLSDQWLSKSFCLCLDGDDGKEELVAANRTWILVAELPPGARAADLDRNGIFDWRDVQLFELANGLPDRISRGMRTLN